MAGFYDLTDLGERFVILTTQANASIIKIHDRRSMERVVINSWYEPVLILVHVLRLINYSSKALCVDWKCGRFYRNQDVSFSVTAARENVTIKSCSCFMSSKSMSDASLCTKTFVFPFPGPAATTIYFDMSSSIISLCTSDNS